jgi:hypothetical protein
MTEEMFEVPGWRLRELTSRIAELESALAAARADNDRMRPVLEAATDRRRAHGTFNADATRSAAVPLLRAVDTYESQESTE